MDSSLEYPLEISPLKAFGAEVRGVDLRLPICEERTDQLRVLLARHGVLVLRGQTITAADQVRFTRYFGDLEPSLSKRPDNHHLGGSPDVLLLHNRPNSPTAEYGFAWHSDGLAYARLPHGVTVLHCIACPRGVGDTLFADQVAAYNGLPETLQERIDQLYWYLPEMPFSEVPRGAALAQPMVRTHSLTDKKFIYCSPNARRICGMTVEKSIEVLDAVHDSQVRDGIIYRHSWLVGDVVLWDNCSVLHNRADVVDFSMHGLREMWRTATAGHHAAIECEPPIDRI